MNSIPYRNINNGIDQKVNHLIKNFRAGFSRNPLAFLTMVSQEQL